MNAPTHTPGPWKATDKDRTENHYKVRGTHLGKRWNVANCPFVPNSPEDKAEAEANARLIAAAPRLLEMCELAVSVISNRATHEHEFKSLNSIRSAIAEATGGAR